MGHGDRFLILANFLVFYGEEYQNGNPELQTLRGRAKWIKRNMPWRLFVPFARVPVGLIHHFDEDDEDGE